MNQFGNNAIGNKGRQGSENHLICFILIAWGLPVRVCAQTGLGAINFLKRFELKIVNVRL